MSNKPTFEEKLARLGVIVGDLESGELSLDKSIALYEEGNSLAKALTEELATAKLKIDKI